MVARTLEKISDDILVKQVKLKEAEDKVKTIEDEIKVLKDELKLAAEKEGLTLGGGKKSKWSIEPQIVPQASNWDLFYAYIKDNDYFHLLQRRPAVKACQELWGQGTMIPGIDKFTSMKVTVKGNTK